MKNPESLKEYLSLQIELIGRFTSHGGTAEGWVSRRAAAFRRRYGRLMPNLPDQRPQLNR